MTKVEINGRTYCVETLIYTVERLTKEVKASAEYHRAVLEQIRAEIEQEYNRLSATRADETLELGECLGLKMSLKIIDKYKAESKVQSDT